MNIEGKVAVVSGGASGIGRATVVALAQQGAKVLIADLDEEIPASTPTPVAVETGTIRVSL